MDDARVRIGRPSLVDSAEEALRNWLAPVRHRAGDRLPPEQDLASMLGISRGTLRTALQRLEASGDIVRRQGSGTFVGEVARPISFREGLERLESYSSLARARGIMLSARDVNVERVPVDSHVAERLGVAAGTPAVRVERVVIADGRPLAKMVDTVHPDAPLPPEARLRRAIERGDMVLDVLLARAVPIAYSTTSIGARLVDPEDPEAPALGVTTPTAVLQFEELYHTTAGDVVGHSRDVFAPDGLDPQVVRWLEARRPVKIDAARRAAPRRRSRGTRPKRGSA